MINEDENDNDNNRNGIVFKDKDDNDMLWSVDDNNDEGMFSFRGGSVPLSPG